MGKANNILNRFLLLVIFIYLFTLYSFPIPSNSLTIKLIRRDVIDSNLFPKNLSTAEKRKIYADLGHSRALRFNKKALSSSNSFNESAENPMDDTISPKLSKLMDSMFVVPFAIGSQRYSTYLLFDTGSDFTWLQSKGCTHCFQLRGEPFDRERSSSHHDMPFNDPLCRRKFRVGEACGFRMNYVSAKNVKGIVIFDNVYFPDTTGHELTIPNVALGCATFAPRKMFGDNDGPNNKIAGIFGLSKGSFRDSLMEVTHNITKWKFSYCLPPWSTHDLETTLQFGDDVQPLPSGAHTTPLIKTSVFHVILNDISVAGEPLHLNPEWFQVRRNRGGFILDTGTALTFLVAPAYAKVRKAYVRVLRRYMKPLKMEVDHELCYKWPLPQILQPPSMVYHFENADLEVDFMNVFEKVADSAGREIFCMALEPLKREGSVNNLGAVHQANYRFVHNLEHKTLSFYRDNCRGN